MATNNFTNMPPLTIDSLKQSIELLRVIAPMPTMSHVVAHPATPFLAGLDRAAPDSDRTVHGLVDSFGGIKVITSPLMTMTKQTRFPRSKRQRIRRKWAKKYTETVPSDKVLVFSQEAMRRAMRDFWSGIHF